MDICNQIGMMQYKHFIHVLFYNLANHFFLISYNLMKVERKEDLVATHLLNWLENVLII